MGWLLIEMTVSWNDWWLGWLLEEILLIGMTDDQLDCWLGWLLTGMAAYLSSHKLFTTCNSVRYLSCLNRALAEYQFCGLLYDTKKQLDQDCVLKPQHGPLLTLRLNCWPQGNHDKRKQEEIFKLNKHLRVRNMFDTSLQKEHKWRHMKLITSLLKNQSSGITIISYFVLKDTDLTETFSVTCLDMNIFEK